MLTLLGRRTPARPYGLVFLRRPRTQIPKSRRPASYAHAPPLPPPPPAERASPAAPSSHATSYAHSLSS